MPNKFCDTVRGLSTGLFFRKLLEVLRAASDKPTFAEHWAQSKPRTDIMLGCGVDREKSLLVQALREVGLPIDDRDMVQEPSFERYGDLIYFSPDWYEGKSHPELHIEVENNIEELKGTISDLLFIQSHLKVAVFYADKDGGPKPDSWVRVFADHPFHQSSDIKYILIFLPTKVTAGFPERAYAYSASAGGVKDPASWDPLSG